MPAKVALAVLAPLVLIVIWALVVAPGADNPLPQTARMLIGSALLLLSAAALGLVGKPGTGITVAAVIAVDTAVLLVLPGNPGG